MNKKSLKINNLNRLRMLPLRVVMAMVWLIAAPLASAQAPLALSSGTPDMAQAERLLREGKADDAYRLLVPFEFEQAGKEEYDYLLGIAALESGKADLATLIFERVLAVNPNHAAARLDMGRAYFALGDMDRAKTEFESARRFSPPPAAQTTIDQYLAAIDQKAAGRAFRISGYVNAIVGHDSNVNSSTGQGSLFIPLFGQNLTLANTSRKTRDLFAGYGGGLEASFTLTERISLLGGADLLRRTNYRADTFDYQSLDLRLGAQYASERDTYRVMVGRNTYDLDNASYRNTQNLSLEWRRVLDARTQVSLFGQDARARYLQQSARSNSSNLFLYGLGGVRVLDEGTRTFVYASGFRGVDVATDGRSDADRRLHGGRLGMQRALTAEADWFASVSGQKSTYSLENAIFVATRKDYQLDLNAGINWQFSRDWLLRPQANYTRNDSNIALNDYDRYEFSLTLRHDFR
jgi:outer membrane protein